MNEVINGIFVLIRANIVGWWQVILRGLQILLNLFSKLNFFMIFYAIACLAVVAFSLSHWISYKIQFNETIQSTLGSELRYAFFAPGMIGLLLFFFRVPYRRAICAIVLIIVATLYTIGLVNPGLIHTHIQIESDYSLRAFFTISYGVALAVMMLLFWEALRNPLISQKLLKEYLYARREPGTARILDEEMR